MVKHTSIAFSLVLIGTGACNWMTFDDLRDQAWVERVDKPNSSRQYGAAVGALPVTPQTQAGSGASMVVMGRASVSVSTLRYDQAGKRTTSSVEGQSIFPNFAFTELPVKPAFAVDPVDHPDVAGSPVNHRFAFGGLTGMDEMGQAFVGILNGDNLNLSVAPGRLLAETGDTSAIARMRPTGLAFASVPDSGGMTATFRNLPELGDLAVARGTQLNMLLDYADQTLLGTDFAECTQLNTADFDTAAELVVADLGGADEAPELAVGMGPVDGNQGVASSEIRVYDMASIIKDNSTVATPGPCEAPSQTIAVPSFDGGFAMLAVKLDKDAAKADLIYSAPSINTVFVRFAGATESIQLTVPTTGSNYGYALAAGDLDGDDYPELIVGAPRSDVGGATDAGAVFIYKFDLTNRTFALVDDMSLSPSSPTTGEQFGKSVAVAPWGTSGANVLVVGAEGKVYTYFRTSLYDDVRTGR